METFSEKNPFCFLSVQLRGRVGRADREAHAYMFHPRKELLSDDALVSSFFFNAHFAVSVGTSFHKT